MGWQDTRLEPAPPQQDTSVSSVSLPEPGVEEPEADDDRDDCDDMISVFRIISSIGK
jgi:hypothetical protein